jgi:hypothetical protein
MHNAEVQKFGVMCGCQRHAKFVVWRTHIGFPVFAPCRPSTGSLVMPTRDSSASCVGEKDGLRNLWDDALGWYDRRQRRAKG